MCYAIPGKVVSIEGRIATIDYFGEKRDALILFGPQHAKLKTGEYVYAQGGVIIETISEKDALRILKIWKKRFFELREKDLELSKAAEKQLAVGGNEINGILAKAQTGGVINRKEMKSILGIKDRDVLKKLFQAANSIRAINIQNACCVHGIIEFSNYCINDCAYCGINKNNAQINRYRMTAKEIVETAEYAVKKLGFKALVLQSGEDFFYNDDLLVEIVTKIRASCGVLLFMSIGERTPDCYRRLFDAGARGALLRFETSSPGIYQKLHSRRSLRPRISLIKMLKEIGYVLATGFIIGLPGQTDACLINDILLTRSLEPDMFSFGPLIPHPQTPLASTKRILLERALQVIALARIAAPTSHIVVTTALETLSRKGKKMGLLAGANSLMVNLTPEKYQKYYEIYPGKAGNKQADIIRETLNLLYAIGRAPTDIGFR